MSIESHRPEQTASVAPGDAAPADGALHDLYKALEASLSAPPARDGTAAAAAVPMPRFLDDEAAEEAPSYKAVGARWLSAIVSLAVVALLGAWALASAGGTFKSRGPSPAQSAAIPAAERSRLDFVGTDDCAARPCGGLLTFTAPAETAPATPAQRAAAEAGLDPLGTVVVRGLPPESRLSVGNKISGEAWALTVGDLNGLGLIVPDNYKTPIRATFEIRSRDGRELAVFDLNIARDGKTPQTYETAAGPDAVPQPQRRPPVPGSIGVVPAKADTSSPAQKKAALAKPPFALQGTPAKPAAESKEAPSLLAKSKNAEPPARKQPTPGFETLINLGGGSFAFDPSQR